MKASRVAGLVVGAALLGAPSPGSAQMIEDSRWLPFVGCWESADSAEQAGLLCFRPEGEGVELESIVGGEVVATELLVADGQRRSVVAEECDGWEAVSFSDDGRRAFTTSEFVCDEDERGGTGIMAMVASDEWIDVRAMEIDGEDVAWVQTYTLASRDAMEEAGVDDPRDGLTDNTRAARQLASRGVDLDDVIEAQNNVATEAVVAWLAAYGAEFDVTGDDLVRLSDSGTPDEIIDVVVAVSNPDYFVVAPDQDVERLAPRHVTGRRIPVGIGYRSYLAFDPFYRYGYSPFGYSPWYGGGYYGGYSPWGGRYYPYTPIIQVRERSDTRIIRGQGRTRGDSGGSSGRTARRPGSGSSGGGGATAGSSRGGSSGGGSGRTARRRGSGSQMSSAAPVTRTPTTTRTARPRGIERR